jgi:23S rRNA (guanosine2251-2'-O)-methyltransferase
VFLLLLDEVQDPHNVGACLRSAGAAGVDAVVISKDRAVGLTPTVRKIASGAAEMIPFIQVKNLSQTIKMLKEAGVWCVGAAGEAEMSVYDVGLQGPLAVVMGSEGKGLRRQTKDACDVLVKIPMSGNIESLNVSVATGIMLFEALRQRQ